MSLDTTAAQGLPAATYNRGVSAFFDTHGAAQKATDDLIAAGIGRDRIALTAGQGAGGTTAASSTESKGFLESLKDLFLPEEDRYAYAEGLRRGGYLLTVRTDVADYDRVLGILDADGAVDIDERETQWKSEGWTGYGAATRTSAAATSLEAGTGRDAGLTTGTASPVTRPIAAPGTAVAGGVQRLEATSEETVPVYEERLNVGKRDVSHGRVRLRSYVVETPVNEQVSLHSEQVQVDRRPVDRAVAAGESVFQDRVIEAEERAEEAVVAKEVRVKEEISLRKTADDRTKTISDTVRRTEVEIDDSRGGTAATGTAASFAAATDSSRIAEHMDVIASDGAKIGVVDHLDGPDRIKLAKNASPDGQHHFVPLAWVDHVDTHVHLNKTAADAKAGW